MDQSDFSLFFFLIPVSCHSLEFSIPCLFSLPITSFSPSSRTTLNPRKGLLSLIFFLVAGLRECFPFRVELFRRESRPTALLGLFLGS